jgi:cyclin-A
MKSHCHFQHTQVRMAAQKENSVLIACQAPNGRITRAQAAANRRSFGSFPSIPLPAKAERKQAAQGKTKRGSSYENTSSSAAISGPQPKRRTVLRDVTNVSRANSNKKITAATKLQVFRCSTHNYKEFSIPTISQTFTQT